jgi:iron complex transport system substrate-binding protein
MKTKTLAFVEIAIVLCLLLLVALPITAIAAEQDDYVLGIYGNANEDDTIDMRDLTYVKLIFFGKKPETELADAKYDDKINPLDFIQIKLIIVGKEKELTVIDGADRIVTVKKPIKRIVILAPPIADGIRVLDATDKVVGVSSTVMMGSREAFFPEFSKLPRVGDLMNPDIEAILNLNPDLVITYGGFFVQKLDKLPDSIPVAGFFFNSPIGFQSESLAKESILEEMEKLGYILDKKEEAKEYADWEEGYIIRINERISGLSKDEKPRIYIEGPHNKYQTYNRNSASHPCILLAGGRNIAADLPSPGKGFPQIDPEWVIEQNPDIIIKKPMWGVDGYGVDDPYEMITTRKEILNRPELANINAVKNKRVYVLGCDILMCPSYPVGFAYLAKWFHPDLFKDLEQRAIHQEYLDRFHKDLNFDVYEHGVFAYPEPS